jgi:hypothetical protein
MVLHAFLETLLQVAIAIGIASGAVLLIGLLYVAACVAIDWDRRRLIRNQRDMAFRRNRRLAEELRAKERSSREIAVKDQTRRGPEAVVRGWER